MRPGSEATKPEGTGIEAHEFSGPRKAPLGLPGETVGRDPVVEQRCRQRVRDRFAVRTMDSQTILNNPIKPLHASVSLREVERDRYMFNAARRQKALELLRAKLRTVIGDDFYRQSIAHEQRAKGRNNVRCPKLVTRNLWPLRKSVVNNEEESESLSSHREALRTDQLAGTAKIVLAMDEVPMVRGEAT